MTPYLLIKVVWSFGLLVPTEEMAGADWRAVNAVTALLAAVAVVLALAFTRPWGERLPAWLVAVPVWAGTGLLVPMLCSRRCSAPPPCAATGRPAPRTCGRTSRSW
ncbi:hypothetical protein [Streptomyces sp. SudanB25_2051]|uniref:hypothetical protein n=1 Tax=Streptomyces sp. SudanB25_2051 TaxID=3035275 RepID=UPI003F575427